jgi:hypothetical protein
MTALGSQTDHQLDVQFSLPNPMFAHISPFSTNVVVIYDCRKKNEMREKEKNYKNLRIQ